MHRNGIETQLLERFLRYVRIETTSDRHADTIPSTPGQWELLRLLESELREMGVEDVKLDDNGFLVARIPANTNSTETIGFMSHVDTVSDVSGAGVDPQVHENYDGAPIRVSGDLSIDPATNPDLSRYVGETIVTTNGKTLLGADDKAGVAEMMTLASLLIDDSSLRHGEIELIFTPDEETGKGMDYVPKDRVRSVACYTLDGSEEGVIETECFEAAKADVVCTGISIHTGTARGKLVNAISMMSSFLGMLPRSESPEATDNRFGFYAPIEMRGSVERSSCTILLRDFDGKTLERRSAAIRAFGAAVESAYPGGKVEIEISRQYANMRSYLDADERIVSRLEEAVRMTGIEPETRVIRGGTDGSRLSEMGIPMLNIFIGGHSYHSRSEWAALSVMVRAVETVINLCELWS